MTVMRWVYFLVGACLVVCWLGLVFSAFFAGLGIMGGLVLRGFCFASGVC